MLHTRDGQQAYHAYRGALNNPHVNEESVVVNIGKGDDICRLQRCSPLSSR